MRRHERESRGDDSRHKSSVSRDANARAGRSRTFRMGMGGLPEMPELPEVFRHHCHNEFLNWLVRYRVGYD